MDSLSAVGLASTIILLVSASFSLTTALGNLYTVTDLPHKIWLLYDEVRVIRSVVDECYQTIEGGPIESPQHIKDLLVSTHEQEKEVEKLVAKALHVVPRRGSNSFATRLHFLIKSATFMVRTEKEMTSAVAILRDKVALLRDACSEYVENSRFSVRYSACLQESN